MEANRVPAEIMEAFPVQPAGKPVRKARLQAIEKLQGVNVRKVLVRGRDHASLRPSCNRRFNVGRKQPEAWLFDKADREAKRLACINILPEPVYELYITVIRVKAASHAPAPAFHSPAMRHPTGHSFPAPWDL